MIARVREIGIPARHPWRGVCRLPLLPNEYDRLCDTLAELRQRLEQIMADVTTVECTFLPTVATLDTLHNASATAQSRPTRYRLTPEYDAVLMAFGRIVHE